MSQPLTILEASAAIRDGSLTSSELIESCFAQIDKLESRVHAWVRVDQEAARREARCLDDAAARGHFSGPMHGIPVGVKDIVDVAGVATEAGSPLRAGRIATADAPVVAALRDAGAIILGKTVTTELASFDPPPTRNPWNLDRTPGGSSSGSAVAVALGMCLGAIGSQTGGSITRPASYCGVAGLKPTFGRVSREGVVPVSEHLDHVGPIACRVADLALMFDVLKSTSPGGTAEDKSGATAGLPSSADGVDDVTSALLDKPAVAHADVYKHPLSLGVFESFFLETADAAIRETTLNVIEQLRNAGATVSVVSLPGSFDELHAMHWRIMAVGAAAVHGEDLAAHRERFGPNIAGLLDEGLATSPADYQAALAHQRRFTEQLDARLADVDAVLTPSTDTTAPDRSTTGSPKFNAPFSYAGVPTVSIPCGLCPDGLPASLQLVGRSGRDESLLAAAAWCEQSLGFNQLPPLIR